MQTPPPWRDPGGGGVPLPGRTGGCPINITQFPESPARVSPVPEITLETPETRLENALAHLEDLYEKFAETHKAVMRIDAELTVFLPLLRSLAPGGKPDMLSL